MNESDWQIVNTRQCDSLGSPGCRGTIVTQKRLVSHVMYRPWYMGGTEDDCYETVEGADWYESCDVCDYQDAEPYTY